MANIPTCDLEGFRQQLYNPNTPFENKNQPSKIVKVRKNLVLSYVSDSTGCGHIRNVFPMNYLNSVFGKSGRFNILLSPVMIFQHDILMRSRTIFFQRTMNPQHIPLINRYKQEQKKYGYKMVYDIDDFIWRGDRPGEEIPAYNFGSKGITDDVRTSSIEIMKMMDIVCVSTKFLGDYIAEKGVDKEKIKVVPNSVIRHFWGTQKPKLITEKIKKPRVIYSGSPTHYNNQEKLKGDWDNEWCEWVIKSVKKNKIDFMCMGGLPFFFDSIKDKIKIVNWVNSYMYHLPIKDFNPHFGVAPLVQNYFNYSKSDIKHIEYCAAGALSIGTIFTNDMPSPYDNNYVKVPDNVTVKQLDELFNEYTEPEKYNEIVQKQYQMLENEGRWLESQGFVKRLAEIL